MHNRSDKEYFDIHLKIIKELKENEVLFKQVLNIAQFESELDMGVNPQNLEQANVGYLTEKDFEYINKVSNLVQNRLQNSDWLKKTLHTINNKFLPKKDPLVGVKFDDELFKIGRGILESYLKDLEKNA